ncbi:XrtY-associated glycosyltransferase XYAG1 [Pedobacter psychroterrae]|uniref:Glycosyltransferase n=1 Tax=Pedobacter psychroterrae TaxID=2530453 RepID=A0A4R0NNZ1_9SPHI|nr:glycosyltransferase [Pedobacter psychroterrae]TCD02672.1 glycosyltransferase [Pedobacter psychroterrae]
MKVLHIVPFYKPAFIYGGPIASVSKLCESQQRAGAQVTVITTNANGKASDLKVDTGNFVMVDGVRVRYFDSITNDNTFVSFKLWRYLYTCCRDYDIVHIHTWWNFLVLGAALICRARKVKVVLSPRGMLSEYIFNSTNSGIKKGLHRIFGRSLLKTTIFNATSQQEYDECKALIPGWAGFVLPNVIDLPAIEINKPHKEVFTLSFLSRIDRKKGLEFVFEAITLLNFPVQFRIAGKGEGSYIAELKALTEKLGIADKVEWVGWMGQEQKFAELMQADLFVLASYNENFANVVIEALYAGTPVLISEHVGLASYVADNELGWVTSLDPAEIARAINECHDNQKKTALINAEAHDKIMGHFSPEILSVNYLGRYSDIIEDQFKG